MSVIAGVIGVVAIAAGIYLLCVLLRGGGDAQ